MIARGAKADVCLLLEGTYPYVRGGVSTWIDQLIRAFSHLRFSAILFGGRREDFSQTRYSLPENLVHLETHYIEDSWAMGRPKDRCGGSEYLEASEAVHAWFRDPSAPCPTKTLDRLLRGFGVPGEMTREDFLYGRTVWDRIRAAHLDQAMKSSFVDYFWTIRIMHAPLFLIADVARNAPPARVYHAISTGYAGLLGVFLNRDRGRPLILTEHGIYTKERKIDLANATWINDATPLAGGAAEDWGYTRGLWIRFFEGIGRLAYQVADPIVALYEGNRQRQIRDGAPPDRTRVIPNGIDPKRFEPIWSTRPRTTIPKVVGLIGRVVEIKDTKTFIRAMRTVVREVPGTEGWIVGPTEEDPAYARECQMLVENLGLKNHVRFLGFRKMDEIFPELGLIVLSSISEAMPLVMVEGFAAGIPAVCTDVGACRELIEGTDPEDRALGVAGAVVDIADPDGLGHAVARLLRNPFAWKKASAAGLARVQRYYTAPRMIESYRFIYEEALGRGDV